MYLQEYWNFQKTYYLATDTFIWLIFYQTEYLFRLWLDSIRIRLFCFFNDILIFVTYLMPKPFLWNHSSSRTIEPIPGKDKEIHHFPKAIYPKEYAIAQLEFELTSMSQPSTFTTTEQRFLHYAHEEYLALIIQRTILTNASYFFLRKFQEMPKF